MPLQVQVKATDDLSAVVRAAAPGTQLVLAPGWYSGNIDIDKPLAITGTRSFCPVVLSAQTGSCLTVTSPQTIIWGLHLEAASDAVTLLDIQPDDVAVDRCVLAGHSNIAAAQRTAAWSPTAITDALTTA